MGNSIWLLRPLKTRKSRTFREDEGLGDIRAVRALSRIRHPRCESSPSRPPAKLRSCATAPSTRTVLGPLGSARSEFRQSALIPAVQANRPPCHMGVPRCLLGPNQLMRRCLTTQTATYTGHIEIAGPFQETTPFVHGLAAVRLGREIVYIDRTGCEVFRYATSPRATAQLDSTTNAAKKLTRGKGVVIAIEASITAS